MIARISSRVFIGPELCANEEWLRLSTEYVVEAFIAAQTLRQWHFFFRPVIHWFLPECRKLRATLKRAQEVIKPVIQTRREANRRAREEGNSVKKVADTIGWMDDAAKGRDYDAATAQLGLSMAAIHTTTEMVSGLISDLCENPELVKDLREEIVSVVTNKGWSKGTLHDLKLLDSTMKESQRHHFGDIG